jgi:hypothetical protein
MLAEPFLGHDAILAQQSVDRSHAILNIQIPSTKSQIPNKHQ